MSEHLVEMDRLGDDVKRAQAQKAGGGEKDDVKEDERDFIVWSICLTIVALAASTPRTAAVSMIYRYKQGRKLSEPKYKHTDT